MSRSQLVESGLGSKGALFAEDASSCYALLSISTADDGDKVRLFKLLPEQPRTDLMATIGTESVLTSTNTVCPQLTLFALNWHCSPSTNTVCPQLTLFALN